MIPSYISEFNDLIGVHWGVLLALIFAIYWLGSLVGWWRIPFMCRVSPDLEPIQTPFRRGKNWPLVPEDKSTPRKPVYWDPSDIDGNNAVLEELSRQLKSGRIMRHVVKSLPDHELAREWWLQAAKKSTCVLIHPLPTFSCVGWAQALDPVVFSAWDRCLLGLERMAIGRGRLTASILGHELVHLTQQVRNRELTREWGHLAEWEAEPLLYPTPSWLKAPPGWLSRRWQGIWRCPFLLELALEAEAHWRFKLSPALAVILIAATLVTIQYGRLLME